MKLKKKYDRDGVEFVENEKDIANKDTQEGVEGSGEKARTLSGGRKPGSTSTGESYHHHR